LARKGLHDQVRHVAQRHETQEPPQQSEGLDWEPRELVEDQLPHFLRSDAVDFFSRQAAWIDRGALEVLVPVEGVVDESALDVLLPQRRTAIDTQAVEAEAVNADPRRKAKRGPQVLLGLVGNT